MELVKVSKISDIMKHSIDYKAFYRLRSELKKELVFGLDRFSFPIFYCVIQDEWQNRNPSGFQKCE